MMLVRVSVSADPEFRLQLDYSTSNNRSAEGTWPHISARARLPLLPWNGFRARLNRNTVMRKRNRSHDTIHCCQHLPLTAGITNPPRIGLRPELQRNDDRKTERY